MNRAVSVVVRNGTKILVGRRLDDQTIVLPGGHVEPGEVADRAAMREVFEEAGILGHWEDLRYLGRDYNGSTAVDSYELVTDDTFAHSDFDPDQEVGEWGWLDVSTGIPSWMLSSFRYQPDLALQRVGLWDESVQKSLKSGFLALGLAGAMTMPMGAQAEEKPVDGTLAALKVPPDLSKWTPTGLPTDMHPIAHKESSWGKILHHAKNSRGDYHTAFGALGFKPVTGHEEYKRTKAMQDKWPGLHDEAAFTNAFKTNHLFYNDMAATHWARLKRLTGSPQKAAYAWRWGIGAAAKADSDTIAKDPYVIDYTKLLTTKKSESLESFLSKAEGEAEGRKPTMADLFAQVATRGAFPDGLSKEAKHQLFEIEGGSRRANEYAKRRFDVAAPIWEEALDIVRNATPEQVVAAHQESVGTPRYELKEPLSQALYVLPFLVDAVHGSAGLPPEDEERARKLLDDTLRIDHSRIRAKITGRLSQEGVFAAKDLSYEQLTDKLNKLRPVETLNRHMRTRFSDGGWHDNPARTYYHHALDKAPTAADFHSLLDRRDREKGAASDPIWYASQYGKNPSLPLSEMRFDRLLQEARAANGKLRLSHDFPSDKKEAVQAHIEDILSKPPPGAFEGETGEALDNAFAYATNDRFKFGQMLNAAIEKNPDAYVPLLHNRVKRWTEFAGTRTADEGAISPVTLEHVDHVLARRIPVEKWGGEGWHPDVRSAFVAGRLMDHGVWDKDPVAARAAWDGMSDTTKDEILRTIPLGPGVEDHKISKHLINAYIDHVHAMSLKGPKYWSGANVSKFGDAFEHNELTSQQVEKMAEAKFNFNMGEIENAKKLESEGNTYLPLRRLGDYSYMLQHPNLSDEGFDKILSMWKTAHDAAPQKATELASWGSHQTPFVNLSNGFLDMIDRPGGEERVKKVIDSIGTWKHRPSHSILTFSGYKEYKKRMADRDPDSDHTESVVYRPWGSKRFGLGALRKLRDFIAARGGTISKKDLVATMGNVPDPVVKAGLLDSKGNLSSDKIHAYIEKLPGTKYNISHSVWDSELQRHNDKTSRVLQVNLSTDILKKLRAAGVMDTFRKLYDLSFCSGHPVVKNRTLGWVRWSANEDDIEGKLQELEEEHYRWHEERDVQHNSDIEELEREFEENMDQHRATQEAADGDANDTAYDKAVRLFEQTGDEEGKTFHERGRRWAGHWPFVFASMLEDRTDPNHPHHHPSFREILDERQAAEDQNQRDLDDRETENNREFKTRKTALVEALVADRKEYDKEHNAKVEALRKPPADSSGLKIFVDEIQSDLGQHLGRQAAAQAREAGQAPDEAEKVTNKEFPPEHMDKIREIAFAGQHPSEVLHEAFHQWARQTGKIGTPISIWKPEGKITISGDPSKAPPVHMKVGYDEVPTRHGIDTPGEYGEEADLEDGSEHEGQPVSRGVVRKNNVE